MPGPRGVVLAFHPASALGPWNTWTTGVRRGSILLNLMKAVRRRISADGNRLG
jgi:hypothetical protein